MRYAIISDIHSNLEAFETVLAECRKAKVEKIICCGDIVGYGANPKECLNLVRKLNIVAVAGNHDWAVSGRLDFSHFTPDGQAAVVWNRAHLSMEDIAYLNQLPLILKNKECTLVHSSLNDPQRFIYLTSAAKAQDAFVYLETQVCFLGHTHVPNIFIQRGENVMAHSSEELELLPDCKYLINVGSVGQPRDGNPLASFCVYDAAAKTIQVRRVLYDVKKAQQKIIEAGLPQNLGLRLQVGQ